MKVMGQELTGKLGTPEEYAEAYRQMIALGTDLEALNSANHIGLEKKQITMAHFQAAALRYRYRPGQLPEHDGPPGAINPGRRERKMNQALSYKQIVGCIAAITTKEDYNTVCGMIDFSFQKEKISWKDHEVLYAVMRHIKVED